MPATYSIEEWARVALVGNKDATSPTDEILEPFVASVIGELSSAYPCIGDDPLTDLTAQSDLDAFTEWAGYAVAERYMDTPAGALLSGSSGGTVKVKIGPTERTRKDADPAELCKGYRRKGNAARLRVSCIREAIAEANNNGNNVLDVVGRRRTIGTSGTIEGGLLGLGRCGRR